MNRKVWLLMALLLSAAFVLCGCAAQVNPLEKAQATAVPGLNMELHAASASDSNVDTLSASLYYRYLNEPFLAAETRLLTVRRDESAELAMIRALLEGPSAGHSDLKPLFPEGVAVESVSQMDGILYVTLNEALLRETGGQATPLLRSLTLQSLVATVTESFPYKGVQFLVHGTGQAQSSLRLPNSYFLSDAAGLSDPLPRDESLLLTPQNTATLLLSAWQALDFETLYSFIANVENGEPKPSYQDVSLRLDAFPALSGFSVAGGSVSRNGDRAVVTAQLTLLKDQDLTAQLVYPLALIRENDVWKISYADLQAMMDQ